ncbi:hypothetical protein AHAS_Ahas06G0141800 [Arachis hypogaea]
MNLMVRKFDLSEMWNSMVDSALRTTAFYHISRIGGNQRACFFTSCSRENVEAGDSHFHIAGIFWLKLRDLSKNLIQRLKRTANAVGF